MKKGFLKKILCLGAAVAMLVSTILPVSAANGEAVTSATEMGGTYFSTLSGVSGDPSLTIAKYKYGDQDAPDESEPIQGVEFKYLKVGNLYQLDVDGKQVMAYGVNKTFANAVVLLQAGADYSDNDNLYYTDGSVIQNQVRSKTASELSSYLNQAGASTGTTNASGIIQADLDETNPWGLYLVVETSVVNAKDKDGNPISITKTQAPFIAALPTYNETDKNWNDQITAKVKNSTDTARVEKKIVTDDTPKNDPDDDVIDDTDITTIGDTVYFRLMGTVPSIPKDSSERITTYVLRDNISKGLTLNTTPNKITAVGGKSSITLESTDYTITTSDYEPATDQSEKQEYEGGDTILITFTENGLTKLTNWAKDEGAVERQIYFYFTATVNTDAVIGEKAELNSANSGNPNEVRLEYQISGSSLIRTAWDVVTEFTFGIDVTKTLGSTTESIDASNNTKIEFIVYSEAQDDAKTYYTFEGSNGSYHTPGKVIGEAAATKLNPSSSDGEIVIKGLDEGTYYVKETNTIDGYILLTEPVKFKITADKGNNTFVGTGNQYLGTINTNQSGFPSATVTNTKGFTLPSTGGAGIWMFVIGGVLVIGAGCAYFVMTKRRKEGR